MNPEQQSRNQTKILSCQQKIFGLVVQMNTVLLPAKFLAACKEFYRGFPGSVPQGGTHGFGANRARKMRALPGTPPRVSAVKSLLVAAGLLCGPGWVEFVRFMPMKLP